MEAALLLPDVVAMVLIFLARSWTIALNLCDAGMNPKEHRTKEACLVREGLLNELVEAGHILDVVRDKSDPCYVHLHTATCDGSNVRAVLLLCSDVRKVILSGIRVPLPYSWRAQDVSLQRPFNGNICSATFQHFLKTETWEPVVQSWQPCAPVLDHDSLLVFFLEQNEKPPMD